MTSVIPEVKPPNLSLHQSRLPGSRDDGSRRVRNDGTRRVPLLAGYDRRLPSVIGRAGVRIRQRDRDRSFSKKNDGI